MALAALGFALLSVVAAVVIALRLARTERVRTESLVVTLERALTMSEAERKLTRAEAVRAVTTAGHGQRRAEAALVRVLGAALGIGTIGAASLVVQLGPVELVTLGAGGVPVLHSAAYSILGLGALGVLGAGIVVGCLRQRRLSVAAQARLLAAPGELDRGQKSR